MEKIRGDGNNLNVDGDQKSITHKETAMKQPIKTPNPERRLP
jgi:hypothetical protein